MVVSVVVVVNVVVSGRMKQRSNDRQGYRLGRIETGRITCSRQR